MGWLNNPSKNDTILRTIHDLIYLLSQILVVNQPANKTPVHRHRASSQLGPNKVSSTTHLCIMYGLPQVQEPWTKSFATISQSKDFYLVSRLSLAFCRSNENLLTYFYELFLFYHFALTAWILVSKNNMDCITSSVLSSLKSSADGQLQYFGPFLLL